MRFYLISGFSADSNYLMKQLLSKTSKEIPNILFFANASNDHLDSLNRFNNTLKGLKCNVFLFNNDISMINEADILFFGGGITQKIVEELMVYKNDFINSNKILAGMSAGANMWFKMGMGDYYSYPNNFHIYNYKMVKGFDVINATFCPHYQKEDLIIYNDELKEYAVDGFAFENDTALYIDGNYFYVYKQDLRRSCYFFDCLDNYKMIPLYEGIKYKLVR